MPRLSLPGCQHRHELYVPDPAADPEALALRAAEQAGLG
jgi:hypothetical protein